MYCVLGLLNLSRNAISSRSVQANWEALFFFGAVYSAKCKSKGSEWFQSDERVTIECYDNRSSELTSSVNARNSRRQLPEYQNKFVA